MRRLIAYLTALILAVSCMAELEQGGTSTNGELEGAPVTITFSVPDVALAPATKSLDGKTGDITEEPYLDPDMMYVIVCGGSQSIKYIRKAKLKNSREDTVPEDLYPFPEGDRTVTLYDFEVQLELSDQPRTIHFLGNVDENQLISGSYAYDNLPTLLSYSNKQAYWQELHVPGIFADYDKQTGEPIMDGHCYVPDPATEAYFQYIPLIRNFAKIQVTNESENFRLHSYAVIFYPERGSVAPFRSNAPEKKNGFDFNANLPSDYWLSGYEKCSFENLSTDIDYPGNMPAGVALSDVVPEASEFIDPDSSNGRVLLYDPNDTESGFYVYERGVPTDKIGSTFIIVCGKFETDDNWYYYRLDLMETKVEDNQTVSTYYPIYRNFRYNIQLHRISSEGVLSPKAAVNSSTAEDISADISMRHLSDISNGTTRLVVEPFMTRTYSGPAEEGEYYTLYARFFNSVYSDKPDLSKVSVRVELEPLPDNASDILILYDDTGKRIASGGFFFPEAKTVGGVEGIRTIRFNTVEPGEKTITQKIKIIGHNPLNPYDMRLYREVEITLQNKQPLTLTCTNPVSASTSASITLDLTVPSSLPESMFPLKFYIEPERMTLTPDISKDVNLPVVSGRSIATTEAIDKDTPAFQYIRTLTWEEYSNLSGTGNQRTFHCYFKPNRPLSATTIWAYNEYFAKARVSFNNILPLTLTCTDPVLEAEGEPIRLNITTYSNLPESMFPLQFYIKPDAMTFEIAGTDYGTEIDPDDAERFIRTLDWDEYKNLPVNEEMRTFSCDFTTTVAQSATTIRVSGENFETANVSFHTKKSLPTNQFWVMADPDEANGCKVSFTCKGNGNYGTHVLQYNVDGSGWMLYQNEAVIELDPGHKVAWRSVGTSDDWNADHGFKFYCYTGNKKDAKNGKFSVGGNIASLIMGDDYPDAESYTGAYSFVNFFKGHINLTDASELVLPMATCKDMCYKSMFEGCTSLVSPPELPAMNLAKQCYRNMFFNCSSLVYAPALPATKLVNGAYQRMFYGCTKVNYIKMLAKEGYRDDAFFSDNTNWCAGVAATGEIWLNSAIQNDPKWDSTWGKVLPANWEIHWVEVTE